MTKTMEQVECSVCGNTLYCEGINTESVEVAESYEPKNVLTTPINPDTVRHYSEYPECERLKAEIDHRKKLMDTIRKRKILLSALDTETLEWLVRVTAGLDE